MTPWVGGRACRGYCKDGEIQERVCLVMVGGALFELVFIWEGIGRERASSIITSSDPDGLWQRL
jgi:hypothetical protein